MREHKKLHLGIIGWAMILTGAMSLGSCSSDETLDAIEPKAITFGSVTMENLSRATDPSYGDNKLIDQFNVWGTVTGNVSSAQIFNGAAVTRGEAAYGAAWACSSTQYWIPSATYKFMAISNADPTKVTKDDSGIPTAIEFALTDGTKDLLLGEIADKGIKTITTDANATPSTTGPVAFTMSHLLSKVHFTFDGTADIKNIQVIGHYGTGTYTIGGNTPGWVTDEDDIIESSSSALSFGVLASDGTSEHARLIIPGEQEWTINLLDADGDIIGNSIILNNATATGNEAAEGGFTFEANKQYNIKITLDVKLSLSVDVLNWTPVSVESAFAQTPSVGKKIVWDTDINDDGTADYDIQDDEVILNEDINVPARFTFQLTGPKGGEWIAYFVKEGGVSNAFTLNVEGDDSRDVTCQGKVGEGDDCIYTIEVRAKGVNNTSVTNKAELRFMIRQAGQLLPVDALTTLSGSRNYKILQNPPQQ